MGGIRHLFAESRFGSRQSYRTNFRAGGFSDEHQRFRVRLFANAFPQTLLSLLQLGLLAPQNFRGVRAASSKCGQQARAPRTQKDVYGSYDPPDPGESSRLLR